MKLYWMYIEPFQGDQGSLWHSNQRLPLVSWDLIDLTQAPNCGHDFGQDLFCDEHHLQAQVEIHSHEVKDLCGKEVP